MNKIQTYLNVFLKYRTHSKLFFCYRQQSEQSNENTVIYSIHILTSDQLESKRDKRKQGRMERGDQIVGEGKSRF